jgi:hypothetical protein
LTIGKKVLKSAIRFGISISEYNEMTPYELQLYGDIFEEKREEKLTLIMVVRMVA